MSDSEIQTDSRAVLAQLRTARETRGWTQQRAARELGVARTTMVAIEKGDRRLKPEELVRLAELYGLRLSELVQRGAPTEGFVVQLRARLRASGLASDLLPHIDAFRRLCEDYAHLEALCSAPMRRRDPRPYEIDGAEPEIEAEDVATTERRRLGLGQGPLLDLREVLERDVGLRIFQPELPSSVAGMFAYTVELGGCVALNRLHPLERRRHSLAHEYGHFLTDRRNSEILHSQPYRRLPAGERFAEAFARSFLMPADGLRRRFLALQRDRSGAPTYGDLCRLAHFYATSLEAMTRRLETLRLVPAGLWERLRRKGLRTFDAGRLLRLESPDPEDELLPTRFVALAVEAWERSKLSEGQLARMLRTDRLRARKIVDPISEPLALDTPLFGAAA